MQSMATVGTLLTGNIAVGSSLMNGKPVRVHGPPKINHVNQADYKIHSTKNSSTRSKKKTGHKKSK
jgi:hypothetical protein